MRLTNNRSPSIIKAGGDERAKTKAEIQRDYEKRSGYASQKKYQQTNTKRIAFDVNLKTDQDIIQRLSEVPNKQGYIKELIRADIAKQK